MYLVYLIWGTKYVHLETLSITFGALQNCGLFAVFYFCTVVTVVLIGMKYLQYMNFQIM